MNKKQERVSNDSKTRNTLRFPFVVVIVLTILSGVVHGVFDGRWRQQADLVAIGNKLQDIPDQIGEWKLARAAGLSEDAQQLLRCYGSLQRVYQKGDVEVTVAVMYGPRGPLAVHTPEICYSSVGTRPVDDRKRDKIKGKQADHNLWSQQFAKMPTGQPIIDVWYGWSKGEEWIAGESPRFWLTNQLYKIQLAGPYISEANRPCREFLEVFIPELEKRLVPEKGSLPILSLK